MINCRIGVDLVETGWLKWTGPERWHDVALPRLIAPTNGGLRHEPRHQVIDCLHCLSAYSTATLVT